MRQKVNHPISTNLKCDFRLVEIFIDKFSIFYYRGKDKSVSNENEIDLTIEENGVLERGG
jgi:hypothetical protein